MKAIKGSEADQNQGAQLASTELETLKAKQFQQKFVRKAADLYLPFLISLGF